MEYEEILKHHDILNDEPQVLQGMAEYHQVSFYSNFILHTFSHSSSISKRLNRDLAKSPSLIAKWCGGNNAAATILPSEFKKLNVAQACSVLSISTLI